MLLAKINYTALFLVLGAVLFIISWWNCDTEDSKYEVNAATVETNNHPST